MTKIDYRSRARAHLNKAEQLLASNCDSDVSYAALELRKTIEAIAYERVQVYQAEFTDAQLRQWQAPKVLAAIAAVDPGIAFIRKLSVKAEDDNSEWIEFGFDFPPDMNSMKNHHHTLGSYLHIPTVHNIKNGKDHDFSKARKKCEDILADLKQVKAAENWIISECRLVQFQCARYGCEGTIKRSVNALEKRASYVPPDHLEMACFDCEATYKITSPTDGRIEIVSLLDRMKCQHPDCDHVMEIWHADARNALARKEELTLICEGCNQNSRVVLGVTPC